MLRKGWYYFLHTAKVRISRPIGSHSGLLNFLALSRKTGPMAAWCATWWWWWSQCAPYTSQQATSYKIYLNSRLGKPGEGHEDLFLLVEVAPGHGEDDANHPEDQGGGEDGQTLPCWLWVDLVHLKIFHCFLIQTAFESPELQSQWEQKESVRGWSTFCQRRCSPDCGPSNPPFI